MANVQTLDDFYETFIISSLSHLLSMFKVIVVSSIFKVKYFLNKAKTSSFSLLELGQHFPQRTADLMLPNSRKLVARHGIDSESQPRGMQSIQRQSAIGFLHRLWQKVWRCKNRNRDPSGSIK